MTTDDTALSEIWNAIFSEPLMRGRPGIKILKKRWLYMLQRAEVGVLKSTALPVHACTAKGQTEDEGARYQSHQI
jgi:hypothetical protein